MVLSLTALPYCAAVVTAGVQRGKAILKNFLFLKDFLICNDMIRNEGKEEERAFPSRNVNMLKKLIALKEKSAIQEREVKHAFC